MSPGLAPLFWVSREIWGYWPTGIVFIARQKHSTDKGKGTPARSRQPSPFTRGYPTAPSQPGAPCVPQHTPAHKGLFVPGGTCLPPPRIPISPGVPEPVPSSEGLWQLLPPRAVSRRAPAHGLAELWAGRVALPAQAGTRGQARIPRCAAHHSRAVERVSDKTRTRGTGGISCHPGKVPQPSSRDGSTDLKQCSRMDWAREAQRPVLHLEIQITAREPPRKAKSALPLPMLQPAQVRMGPAQV